MSGLPNNTGGILLGIALLIIGIVLIIYGIDRSNFLNSNYYSVGIGIAFMVGGIYVFRTL